MHVVKLLASVKSWWRFFIYLTWAFIKPRSPGIFSVICDLDKHRTFKGKLFVTHVNKRIKLNVTNMSYMKAHRLCDQTSSIFRDYMSH